MHIHLLVISYHNMGKKDRILWLDEPQDHDYPSAASYLRLLYDGKTVTACVRKLKAAKISEFKAKDIFRAS